LVSELIFSLFDDFFITLTHDVLPHPTFRKGKNIQIIDQAKPLQIFNFLYPSTKLLNRFTQLHNIIEIYRFNAAILRAGNEVYNAQAVGVRAVVNVEGGADFDVFEPEVAGFPFVQFVVLIDANLDDTFVNNVNIGVV
jgi:hypothetical protein